jgi:hypothetical protein
MKLIFGIYFKIDLHFSKLCDGFVDEKRDHEKKNNDFRKWTLQYFMSSHVYYKRTWAYDMYDSSIIGILQSRDILYQSRN